jgi:mannitol/fructose-specific phosphotransferase system IIA component (Ntr-type)
LNKARERVEEFFQLPVLIIIPGVDHSLEIAAGDPTRFQFDQHEMTVAQWVFDHTHLYIPLKGIQSTVGVLAIRPVDAAYLTAPEQLQLLETFAVGIGGALESTKTSEAAGRAEMQLEMLAFSSFRSAGAQLSTFLDEKRVLIFAPGTSNDRIVKDLITLLALPNFMQAFQAIAERERLGLTVIVPGLAVPHARLPGLKGIRVALGVSPDNPIKIWILFFTAEDDSRSHLDFLASVSAFFQKEERIEALSQLKSASDIMDYIKECQSTE